MHMPELHLKAIKFIKIKFKKNPKHVSYTLFSHYRYVQYIHM